MHQLAFIKTCKIRFVLPIDMLDALNNIYQQVLLRSLLIVLRWLNWCDSVVINKKILVIFYIYKLIEYIHLQRYQLLLLSDLFQYHPRHISVITHNALYSKTFL